MTILFSGSLNPLHKGHEEFIEKVQNKTWEDLFFSLKLGPELINYLKVTKKKLGENSNFSELVQSIEKTLSSLELKEHFLPAEKVKDLLLYLYPSYEVEISWAKRPEWFKKIALWNDNLNLLVKSLNAWKISSLPYEKIYLIKRPNIETMDYKAIFKKFSIDIELIDLWTSSYTCSSSEIIRQYNNWNVAYVRENLSEQVLNYLRENTELKI